MIFCEKITLITTIVFLYFQQVTSQNLSPSTLLENTISETSGLILLNNRLITHNDSGNTAELYEIDSSSGLITRSLEITNTTNIDWEDITYDDMYIYIGDFGNNSGDRQNLSIYRVLITDYLTASSSVIADGVINFNYKEQIDFTPSPFATNFDAEALISIENNLYLFTKNWNNFQTDIYRIPKIPGEYEIQKIATLNTQGLITGATYNASLNEILLTGYTTNGEAFLVELSNLNTTDFSFETLNRKILAIPTDNSFQIEAITQKNEDTYYITSEEFQNRSATLFELSSNTLSVSTKFNATKTPSLFPNPTSGLLTIENPNYIKASIFDMKGVFIKKTTAREISIEKLPTGIYLVQLSHANKNNEYIKVIKR